MTAPRLSVLAAALSLAASPAGAAAPRPPALVLQVDAGTVSIAGDGTLTARLRSGSAWVSAGTSDGLAFVDASRCAPAANGESCSGEPLRVELRRAGGYDLRLDGTGLAVSATGMGSASLDGTGGSYRLRGGRPRRLAPGLRVLRY